MSSTPQKTRNTALYTLMPGVYIPIPVGAPSVLIPLTFPGSTNGLPIGRIEFSFEKVPTGSNNPQLSCNGGVCHLAEAGLWYVRHVGSTMPMTVQVIEVSGDAEARAYVDNSVGNFVTIGQVQAVAGLTLLADVNPLRTGIIVQNLMVTATAILRVSHLAALATVSQGARVGPLGSLDLSGPYNYKGAIWAFPEVGSINALVIEASR